MTDDLPRAVDDMLSPRVSTKLAARYLGRSVRWVQQQIHAGKLAALDTSEPGSARACWAIRVCDLRELLVRCELQAQRRIREAAEREPEREKQAPGANEGARRAG